jgi:hypothetical protein
MVKFFWAPGIAAVSVRLTALLANIDGMLRRCSAIESARGVDIVLAYLDGGTFSVYSP